MELKKINFENTYFYSLIIFAFTMPLSRAAISFFMIWFALLFLIQLTIQYKEIAQKIKTSKALWFLGAFLLYQFLGYFYSEDKILAQDTLKDYLYLIIIFVLSLNIKTTWIKKIITAFLSGMFVSEVIAYGVFFEMWSFNNATPTDPSPFMMHIDYSVYLAFASILLLNRLFSSHYTWKEKLFIGVFFLTVTGNLFITGGRTGQVAFIAGIIVMSFLHFRFSYKTIISSFLLLGVIFSSAFFLSENFQGRVRQAQADVQQMVQNNNFNGSWGIRVMFCKIAYETLKENPLFGVGVGDYMLATQKIFQENPNFNKQVSKRAKEFLWSNHYHNQFLMILVQSGLIGLMLFLSFIYFVSKTPINDKELAHIKMLFLTIFLVSCLPEPLLMKQYTRTLFILFISFFIAFDIAKNHTTTDVRE